MKTSFSAPSGLVERSFKESGPIQRSGFLNYGLILTNSPGHSVNDFDTSKLVGVTLENTGLPGDPDRFFTILGGYYLSTDNSSGTHEPKTLSVFGIALNRAKGFEIVQDGSVVLSDHWQLKNPPAGEHPIAGMRERNFMGGNVTIESQTGWTFIVKEARSFEKFPKSRVPLNLFTECPTVKEITMQVVQTSNADYTIQFNAITDGPTPDTYTWDWGDGSPPEITTSSNISHTFSRPPGDDINLNVNVTLSGPGPCQESGSLPVVILGICPIVSGIQAVAVNKSATEQTYQFTAVVTGPPAGSYTWDFGDGSPPQTTQTPTASHTFVLPTGDAENRTIRVTLSGPGSCKSNSDTQIKLGGICPDVSGINTEILSGDALALEVQFTAAVQGPTPDSYNWDFGDGSAHVTTPTPKVVHVFTRVPGNPTTSQIQLTVNGPDSCQASAQVQIDFPTPCPILQEINANVEPAIGPDQIVRLAVVVTGFKPDSYAWDWGDGSPPETTLTPNNTHHYQRPAGDENVYTATVKIIGPGNCESSGSTNVTITGICPVIKQITTTAGPLEEKTQEVSFTVGIEGPSPTSFVWDFGDGSAKKTTTTPQVSHVYNRPAGDLETYQVSVSTEGPDSCRGSAQTDVSISGSCPVISQLTFDVENVTESEYTIKATASIHGPAPDEFKWDWGDGSALEVTTTPSASHTYPRPAGDAIDNHISVSIKGPDSCESSHQLVIKVPGVCPEITGLKQEELASGEGTLNVKFDLEVKGPTPSEVTWDWGDGTPAETTTGLTATHVYTMPAGDPVTYPVTVNTSGPGGCTATTQTNVEVLGVCPVILDIKTVLGSQALNTQDVTASVTVVGPRITKYEWDWGDGSAVETTKGPEATHIYIRESGDPGTYTIKVKAIGPGSCISTKETTVSIDESCPVIGALATQLVNTQPQHEIIDFQVSVQNGTPDRFEWNWGDGSPVETTQTPQASHKFDRKSDNKGYSVSVKTFGPGDCGGDASLQVTIPALEIECPTLTSVKATKGAETEKNITYKFDVNVDGGKPDRYEWDWADGSAIETTTSPNSSHTFKKDPNKPQTCSVTVKSFGPGNCKGSTFTAVQVPKEEETKIPILCTLFTLLAGLFLALAAGTAVIQYVGDSYSGAGADDASWPMILMLVFAAIFAIIVILFYSRGKSSKCPPGKCDWYAWAMLALLAVMGVSFYMMNCTTGNWWLVPVISFIGAGVFGYLWFRFCALESKAQRFFMYLAMFLVATLVVIFAIARPYLACV